VSLLELVDLFLLRFLRLLLLRWLLRFGAWVSSLLELLSGVVVDLSDSSPTVTTSSCLRFFLALSASFAFFFLLLLFRLGDLRLEICWSLGWHDKRKVDVMSAPSIDFYIHGIGPDRLTSIFLKARLWFVSIKKFMCPLPDGLT
jgi:hypothetical protein